MKTTTCTHEGCTSPAKKTRRLCQAHVTEYARLGIRSLRTAEQRFEMKYEIADSGCWQWTAFITRDGYGRFRLDGAWTDAHRAAYRLFVGSIPDAYEVDHLCMNRTCVNPAHLEAVTHDENMRRQGERQTHCKRGHEYTPENTRYARNGGRYCKACVLRKEPCPHCGKRVNFRQVPAHVRMYHQEVAA